MMTMSRPRTTSVLIYFFIVALTPHHRHDESHPFTFSLTVFPDHRPSSLCLPPFPYVPILYGCPRFESSKVYLRTKCFTSYLTEYCSNLAQQNPCEIQIDRMQVLPDPIFLPPSPTRLMK